MNYAEGHGWRAAADVHVSRGAVDVIHIAGINRVEHVAAELLAPDDKVAIVTADPGAEAGTIIIKNWRQPGVLARGAGARIAWHAVGQ